MKIFTGQQIKELDRATMARESIGSIDLMERAAEAIACRLAALVGEGGEVLLFTGKGNNGGDGLAAARILAGAGFRCSVVAPFAPGEMSADCRTNFERLPDAVRVYTTVEGLYPDPECAVADALLGTGAKGLPEEPARSLIAYINALDNTVYSIDIPSGMHHEHGNDHEHIVRADVTLTIEFPKLAMLLPEAGECCGRIEIVPIDSDPLYIEETPTGYRYITAETVAEFALRRPKFSHKGVYGHALLVCGSAPMPGAAILAASGALRSGCGLVTCHVPLCIAGAMAASVPSAILEPDPCDWFSAVPDDLEKYSVVAIGCGLGRRCATAVTVERTLRECRVPMVIDADALNIIAADPRLMKLIPRGSVLTPHPGEFRRLVGSWTDESDKLERLRGLSSDLQCVVVLKGAHTAVSLPGGQIWFNSTGNSGMATGGSGDVLTGLIAGLIARGYTPPQAAVMGVWLHGRAGDKAAEYFGSEGMNSADLSDFIAEALIEAGQAG